MKFPALALAACLSSSLLGQGTQDGLLLATGVSGSAPDGAPKFLRSTDTLTLGIGDGSATGALANQIFGLLADFVPCAFPICTDIDGNPGTCELNLGANLFEVLPPSVLTANPFLITVPVPADPALWQAPMDEAARLQAYALNPSSARGYSTSNAIDHALIQFAFITESLSNDGARSVHLGDGFTYYGVARTEVWIHANGHLTFGGPDPDFSPTVAEFLSGAPKVAALWTDLDPTTGGTIAWSENRSCQGDLLDFQCSWLNVPAAGFPGALNTFGVILDQVSGQIFMGWGELSPIGSYDLIGVSPGGGAPGVLIDTTGVGSVGTPMQALYDVGGETGCGDTLRDNQSHLGVFAPLGAGYVWGSLIVPPIRLESVLPATGASGQAVTLSGFNFRVGIPYSVRFGATALASNVTLTSACSLSAIVPPGSGTVDITITDPTTSDTTTLAGAYTY